MTSLARLARLAQEVQLQPLTASAQNASQVVCLRKAPADGASTAPLVLFHPIGGSIVPYRDLLSGLRFDRAVFAIQSHADEPRNSMRHPSIEALAADYLAQLASLGLREGFALGGYSLGGAVAFEAARQLADQGKAAPALLIIDTPARIRPAAHTSDQPVSTSQLLMFGQILAGRSTVPLDLSAEELEQLPTAARIDCVLDRLRKSSVIPNHVDDAIYHSIYEMAQHNERLQRAYAPQHYRGPLSLIRTVDEAPELRTEAGESYDDPAFGWQQHCTAPVRIKRVPGNHFQLLYPPFIRTLAAAVQRCLDEI
jgi:thioesterase domain-containing protein